MSDLNLFGGDRPDEELSDVEFAEKYFLNPETPRARRDDPSGEYHFEEFQVANAQGEPLSSLVEDEPIPLYLRDYQRRVMRCRDKQIVLRWGRRTGKSYLLGTFAVTRALRNPNATVLVLAPNQSHIKLLFDDYIRPLLRRAYQHSRSGKFGIEEDLSELGESADFVITKDTQKPQEIIIRGTDGHEAKIRGMVVSSSARGQDASFIIFDEADHVGSQNEVRKVMAPMTYSRPNTRIVMSSTPSGRTDSYFYDACVGSQSTDWTEFHENFTVVPHYDEDMWRRMARQAGGENTNTFKQEYLAEFGEQTKGVFNQSALKRSYIITPEPRVLEDVNRKTYEREPLLADDRGEGEDFIPYQDGVRPMDWNLSHNRIGSRSLYRPQYRGNGTITVGTDWNDLAGMHTVITWWPPAEWIRQGKLEVARFPYDENENPDLSGRATGTGGNPKRFVIGSDNGDPGGPHDLRQVRGIVIWYGQLDSGQLKWQEAANRVAAMMSIPNFVDSWYVDKGYGDQVNSYIHGIMESGEYVADMNALSQARTIPEPLQRNINLFHPSRDQDKTGKIYKPIEFGAKYPHKDFGFVDGEGRYKDVMVTLGQRLVSGERLLFPYGALVGYYDKSDLGDHYEIDQGETGEVYESATSEQNADIIEENGGEPDRGEEAYGGLITQMQSFVIDGYSSRGRPRYAGIDHGIDAFVLSLLAYFENHAEEGPDNIFRDDPKAPTRMEENIFEAAEAASEDTRRVDVNPSTETKGEFQMKEYPSHQATEPLRALYNGTASPREVGTTMQEMLDMTARHYEKKSSGR